MMNDMTWTDGLWAEWARGHEEFAITVSRSISCGPASGQQTDDLFRCPPCPRKSGLCECHMKGWDRGLRWDGLPHLGMAGGK